MITLAAIVCVFTIPDSDIQPAASSSTTAMYASRSRPSPPSSSGIVIPKRPIAFICLDDVGRVLVGVLEVARDREHLALHPAPHSGAQLVADLGVNRGSHAARVRERSGSEEHARRPGTLPATMMHQTMMSFRRDPDAVKGKRLERQLLRRVLGMTRPYRGALIGFFISVIAAAIIGVIPALLFRALIDNAVEEQQRGAGRRPLRRSRSRSPSPAPGLNLVQRWYASRVGEGLIYDMRVALFDHVQRLPISFFTRTQTGSLQSRLNNDVIGAQNAVTGTLGTVISNVITLVVTLSVMLVLEWRLTILTLIVLPAFIIPARRIGRRLQTVTRESFKLDASMNNTIAERFNVSGALVVKLFGNHDRERDYFAERAARVRDIGVTSAMYSRVLFVALGFVAAVGTAVVYLVGGQLVIENAIPLGTLAAFVIYTGQIYQPLTQLTNSRVDVLTAMVSFERVFEVLDFPALLTERPGAVDLVDPVGQDRARPRVVPPPVGRGRLAASRSKRGSPASTTTRRAPGSSAT